jgi:SpoVK/Ycf46/Vps4 family AAA+-type ATPase
MTASMLPKLQDLRDHGHVFFVIATNYFDQIDSAVKRLGRIDRMVGVGWPDKAQRRRIIRTELRDGDALVKLSLERRKRAIDELADQSQYHIRGDIVHFAQALEARQSELATLEDPDKFDERIGEITANVPQIARVHIDHFRDDAVSSSASHVKGQGELR